jgi:hypothetical protein
MIIDEDVYLKHAGISGMRWGIRTQLGFTPHISVHDKVKRVISDATCFSMGKRFIENEKMTTPLSKIKALATADFVKNYTNKTLSRIGNTKVK